MVSNGECTVQTVKSLLGKCEIGLRFRSLPTKMYVVVRANLSSPSADADPVRSQPRAVNVVGALAKKKILLFSQATQGLA